MTALVYFEAVRFGEIPDHALLNMKVTCYRIYAQNFYYCNYRADFVVKSEYPRYHGTPVSANTASLI